MKMHNACYGRQHQHTVEKKSSKFFFEMANFAHQNRIINSTSQLRNEVEYNAEIRPYSHTTRLTRIAATPQQSPTVQQPQIN